MNQWQCFINGSWVDAQSGRTYDVINPADGTVCGRAADGNEADARQAAQAAHEAFAEWSRTPAKERARLMWKLHDLVLERKEELAQIMTLEMGKPIRESRAEVGIAAEYIAWNAEEGRRVYGETIPAPSRSKRLLALRQPVGPVAAITPWNFPLSMITRKLSPALAAGCTVVLKPASQTPGAAAMLCALAEQAGFPAGVINLVTGSPAAIVGEWMSNPRIKKVTFTGSTEVGKQLIRDSAQQVKRVSMELGGHAPFIVFDDADLELAAEGAVASKFRNAGQTCICANRIYVQKSVIETFTRIFKEKVGRLAIGDGCEETTELGPVIDAKGMNKIERQVRDAVSKGAELILGGHRLDRPGFFYAPTILSGVTEEMEITHEETFGPVAPLYAFETEEEVLEKANRSVYGLAAYFYTRDLGRAVRMYEGLDFGIIGCNDPVPTTVEGPFGGMKQSGYGREGGPHSLHDFLETKFVSIGL